MTSPTSPSASPHDPVPSTSNTQRTQRLRRARGVIIALVVVVTAALLLKGLLTPATATTPSATVGAAAPEVNHYAPAFTVRDLANNDITLASLKGKVVALNFWYAACEPCKFEMPALEHTYEQYQSKGFVVLGVDVTDDPATMDTFIHSVGVTYPVARDTDLRAATDYRVTATPSTFFIDRNGVIRYKVVGALDTKTLQTDVGALMR